MFLKRNRLYTTMGLACAAGYIWVYYLIFLKKNIGNATVCLMKKITTIPCPSCGTSRSVEAILSGSFKDAFYFNPLGFIIAPILIILPIWIGYDIFQNRDTLLQKYLYFENIIKNKRIAIPLIILILLNWIWNIYKNI